MKCYEALLFYRVFLSGKVILFLTDGGSQGGSDDSVKKLLSELNAEQNNRVLILTYGIGNGKSSLF